MEIIKLRDEYIKLGQALKAANLVEDGVEAKLVIQDGLVKVNNEVDIRRGRKLYDCGSASTSATFFPSLASPTPRLIVVVVFATPPF